MCPASPCPHRSDHMSQAQQQVACFRKQMNAHIRTHTHTHTHTDSTYFKEPKHFQIHDRNSGPQLACSLDGTKIMLLWN